jgi:phage-related protein
MATAGLLGQLPDLGELEQVRDLVQNGLDGALRQVADDPASLVKPLTDALGPVAGQVPDLTSLIAPLAGQRGQIVDSLPAGLDQQVAAVLPLLGQAEQVVNTGVLQPIVDDLRAGQSLNDIAQRQLKTVLEQQLLGQLPGIKDGALPGDTLAAVNEFLSAAGGFAGGTSDPAVLADFLAEQMLGVPVQSLSGVVTVRDGFFSVLDGMLTATGRTVDDAEQALSGQLAAAAVRLESLDTTQVGEWQAALAELQQARTALDSLRQAMETIPGTVYSGLGQLDLNRYKAELRQALQSLPTAGSGGMAGLGRFATLEGLADDMLQPLDEMTAQLASTSPAAFTGSLKSTLDGLLGLLDIMAGAVQDNPVFDFFDDLKQAVDAVAGAIRSIQSAIEGAIQALVDAVSQVLDEFNAVKQQVEAAFQALASAIEQINVDALAQAVEGLFDQLNGLLAALPLNDLKDKLDQALSMVEKLVNALSEATESALQQVASLAGALEQIEFGPLVEPVIDAINAIKDTLSAINPDLLPDAVRSLLREAIDTFEAQFGGDFKGYFKREVVDFLNKLFDDAVKAVRDFVQGLQDKLRQFAEVVGKLDPAKLLEPLTRVFKQLNDAIAGLSGEKLVAPVRKLLDDALQALQAISPEKLLAPLEQAFEQEILEPVKRFKPSDLLKPLIDAFEPLEELIGKLDFSDAFKGMGDAATGFLDSTQGSLVDDLDFSGVPGVGRMAGQVQPVLNLLQPTTSMDDWTNALDDVLNSYRPSKVLEPVQTALAPVESLLTNASDEVLMATFGRLQALTRVTNVANSSATASALTGRLEQVVAALEGNLPTAVIAGLNSGYTQLQAALKQIDPASVPDSLRPQYDAAQAAVTALDPSAGLSGLSASLAPLAARVRQVAARPVDLSDLEATFGEALSLLGGLLPGFLFSELTPDAIRRGLAAFSPTTLIQRIDERFDAFLSAAQRFGPAIQAAVEGFVDQLGQKLAELSPAALFERFTELFQPIRDALQQISPQAIADALDQAYTQMVEKLAQIHPKVIREPAQELFNAVLGKLNELKQKLLDTVVAAVDQALASIRETLKALDPQALIIGLGNFFDLIRKALEGMTLTAVLDRLAKAFDRLRADLSDALQRAANAFGQMVEAIPV